MATVTAFGSVQYPFTEAFGRIIEVGWGGTVVIVEFPQDFGYYLSNDPASTDFPEVQKFFDPGDPIAKDDYKDNWAMEPMSSTTGRYYTSQDRLVAPIGYDNGYGALELLTSGFPDPIGDGAYAPYSAVGTLAFLDRSGTSQANAAAYYAALGADADLYEIFHQVEEEPEVVVFRYGTQLSFGTGFQMTGIGLATSAIDPADTINAIYEINVPDISRPYCVLVNMAHTNEVEIFQNTTNFQNGHIPAPAFTLTAYSAGKFTVDPTTKRLGPYVSRAPKWTRTIPLRSYPTSGPRFTDTSLGRFNAKGYAAPGDPLP